MVEDMIALRRLRFGAAWEMGRKVAAAAALAVILRKERRFIGWRRVVGWKLRAEG
jgi:hypothetical protein